MGISTGHNDCNMACTLFPSVKANIVWHTIVLSMVSNNRCLLILFTIINAMKFDS